MSAAHVIGIFVRRAVICSRVIVMHSHSCPGSSATGSHGKVVNPSSLVSHLAFEMPSGESV